jgi:hypothetical protein
MKEDLQRRLSEIMELVRERDEIEAKLAGLLGIEEDADVQPQDASEKRVRRCGGCGSTSHDVQSCPSTLHPNNKTYQSASKRNYAPKPCCGSVGVRHKKTCKNGNDDKSEKETEGIRPIIKILNRGQFEELADARYDRDFISSEYALSHKLSPREVSRAVQCLQKLKDYEDYVNEI